MLVTSDGLLNHRITLEQPSKGYRVAVDTVLLAASIEAKPGDHVLDLGCGVGGVMLCLARRLPGVFVEGIDIQTELTELCQKNIKSNGFQSFLDVIREDVIKLPKKYDNRFDHVVMNPPYHEETRHDASPHAGKHLANSEKDDDLQKWIDAAARALKNGGMLTLIHRADRLEDIRGSMQRDFGALHILPIHSKAEKPAKRVIVRGLKGEKTQVNFCRHFVLHKPEDGYTEEAEKILRHMGQLTFITKEE